RARNCRRSARVPGRPRGRCGSRRPRRRGRTPSRVRSRDGDRLADDGAVAHREPPRRAGGEAGVVRRDDHRRAALGGEPGEQVDHVGARFRVEVPGRLVGEDYPRLDGERARDRDALLLAAGELRRQVVCPLGEADLAQEREGAQPQLLARNSRRGEAGLDVLERRQRRDQVELLEDEAEGAQPQLGELVVAELGQVAAFEEHVAGGGTVERAEELQQRRLARPARPLQRDELARLDRQVDAVDGADLDRPLAEDLRDVAQLVEAHSTVLSASAGRRRAARKAPAAPAISPPASASANPIRSTSTAIGAVSGTSSVTVRAVMAPRPKSPPPLPPVADVAVRLGPNAPIAAATATPSATPTRPPPTPCASDSPTT